MRPTFIITATVAALLTVTGQAQAQNNRSFVSGHGADSNVCTLANPCRTFAQAVSQTNANGEIVVLDSAGYGTVVIDKSITITNPGGVDAGITAPAGGNAIMINPSSSIVVTLRGLTIEGAGVGANGIAYAATAPVTLNVIDCVIKDFVANGIVIQPLFSNQATANANVRISNSFVLDNAGNGIFIVPGSINTNVIYAIDHTTVSGNGLSTTNTAGINLNSNAGFFGGTISSVLAQQNGVGVILTGFNLVDTSIRNSVLSHNINGDLTNDDSGVTLLLIGSNQIDSIMNHQRTSSDGTNNIAVTGGNALIPYPRT